MFWSYCYLVLRCVLQLVSLRPRSDHFKKREIVVLRTTAAGIKRRDHLGGHLYEYTPPREPNLRT